jgi:hypothetical protein
LWSVMIPTYNCANYLRETLMSVLAQDPGPEVMQIEVVDDCSTKDDPAAVVAEVAGDRVTFYRQPHNVGHVRNFNTCLQRSRGRLVHLLHGDDRVLENFYETMQRPFLSYPEIGAAFCRDIRIDEDGNWYNISRLLQPNHGILENWLETIAIGQRLQAPAMVVRREVYEKLGGFDQRIQHYGEDWEMWVRIAASYPVWYEVNPLAMYRLRTTSLSGNSLRTGENGDDLRQAIELNKAHLPDDKVAEWSRKASESFALACIRRSFRLLGEGNHTAAMAQLREVWRTSRSPRVSIKLFVALLIFVWMGIRNKHPLAYVLYRGNK